MLRLVQVAVLIRAAVVEGAVIVRSISSSRHCRRGGGGGGAVVPVCCQNLILVAMSFRYLFFEFNVIKSNWYM